MSALLLALILALCCSCAPKPTEQELARAQRTMEHMRGEHGEDYFCGPDTGRDAVIPPTDTSWIYARVYSGPAAIYMSTNYYSVADSALRNETLIDGTRIRIGYRHGRVTSCRVFMPGEPDGLR